MTSVTNRTRKPKGRADGEGSIYQRNNNGLWVASTRFEGKVIAFSAKLRKDAVTKRDKWLEDRKAGLVLTATRWTLGDWLDYWLERKTPRYDAAGNRIEGIEPITLEKYESRIRLYIKPYLGALHIDIAEVSPERIERWQKTLYDLKTSAEIRRQALMVVSQALELAVRRRMLPYNPAAKEQIERPRVLTPKHVQPAEADLKNLLRAIEGDPLEALVWVALGAGLRRAEVAALRWEDITYPWPDSAVIHAHGRVNRLGRRMADRLGMSTSRLERKGLKSQAERNVHVGALFRAALERRWTHQVSQSVLLGSKWHGGQYRADTPSGYVFTTPIGTPIEPDAISKFFAAVRQSAGLDIKTFHGLRRAFTTLMNKAGVNDRVTMEQAGHKHLDMTHYYQDPMESQKHEAAQALDDELRRLLGESGD